MGSENAVVKLALDTLEGLGVAIKNLLTSNLTEENCNDVMLLFLSDIMVISQTLAKAGIGTSEDMKGLVDLVAEKEAARRQANHEDGIEEPSGSDSISIDLQDLIKLEGKDAMEKLKSLLLSATVQGTLPDIGLSSIAGGVASEEDEEEDDGDYKDQYDETEGARGASLEPPALHPKLMEEPKKDKPSTPPVLSRPDHPDDEDDDELLRRIRKERLEKLHKDDLSEAPPAEVQEFHDFD